MTFQDGTHVVPLTPSSRIQVYDRNWRFLRGWRVAVNGGNFKLRPEGEDIVEVFIARGNTRYVFSRSGDVLLRGSYSAGFSPELDGESIFVPTQPWLMVFSSPFLSWAVIAIGGVMLVVLHRKETGSWRLPS